MLCAESSTVDESRAQYFRSWSTSNLFYFQLKYRSAKPGRPRYKSSQVKFKSSQVANFHRHKQMRQAKSPAQQNKEHRVRRAYNAADIKSPGTPPVYGTGWTNFPWADRFMAVVPTRECIPLLYLLHYHKADVTSQTRVLLRQNDVIHCAHQISRAQDPKRRCPG